MADSKKKSFLLHAGIYTLGSLAMQASSFLLIPLYTRYLAVSEFGVLELINRTGEIINICLMLAGIRMAALTFYQQSDSEQQRGQTAATLSLFVVGMLAVGMMIAVFCGPFLARELRIDDWKLLVFGLFAVFLEATTIVPLVLMQARMESGWFVLVSLANLVLRVALICVAVIVLKLGLWGVLYATALAWGITGVLLTLRELMIGSFRPNSKMFADAARFALPFIPGGICFFLMQNGDRFFLSRLMDNDQVGLYAMGAKMGSVVAMFSITPLSRVWSVEIYRLFKQPDAPKAVGQAATLMCGVYLGIGCAFCIFQNLILKLFGSSDYNASLSLIGPVVFACFFQQLANLMDAPFYVCRRTALKPWIVLASTVVTLPLYYVFIRQFGTMGAAYALLSGYLFHTVLTWIVAQRVAAVHYEFGRLAVMLGLACPLVVLGQPLPFTVIGFLLKGLIWSVWPITLWFTGVIGPEEKAYLKRTFHSLLKKVFPGPALPAPPSSTLAVEEETIALATDTATSAVPKA